MCNRVLTAPLLPVTPKDLMKAMKAYIKVLNVIQKVLKDNNNNIICLYLERLFVGEGNVRIRITIFI